MNLNIFQKKAKAFTETGEPIQKKKKKGSGKAKEVLAKLSRGLMLPIAMLPIAGIVLGIGSAIVTAAGSGAEINQALFIFGNILKMPGQVVFDNLPVLFAIAIAITFTKDAGVAGLSAFVGWIVFCAFQTALISGSETSGYHFLWYNYYGDDISIFNSIFTSNVGLKSLSTSVFGGMTIGFSVAFLYNKFRNIQLPSIIGFFSGVRFIPIVTFGASILASLLFAMVWPVIGQGLYLLGSALSSTPFGLNSFIYGFVNRALLPFGLHHAFYTPLYYTAAGGIFTTGNAALVSINGNVYQVVVNGIGATWADWIGEIPKTVQGDQQIWIFMQSSITGKMATLAPYDINTHQIIAGGDLISKTLTFDMVTQGTKFASSNGLTTCNPGQYLEGAYPVMMFALPAAGAAMVMAAPKGNRKVAMSIVGSAAFTSFLTGVTEPIEFTFLFLAPWLFWGFHCVGVGICYWLMNLFGAHMGLTFSGGVIDFFIYGVVADSIGAGANCWLACIIGPCAAAVYFVVFYFSIKKFDIKTPGRGETTKMFTKKDFLARQEEQKNSENQNNDKLEIKAGKAFAEMSDERFESIEIIKAYGGLANILNVDACITKLRIQVKNQDIVNKQQLMDLGAKGVMKPSPQSVYAVFGTKADRYKNEINDIIADVKDHPELINEYFGK